jgi:hypothetical protein
MTETVGSLSYRLLASCVVIPSAGGLLCHPFGQS